MAATVWRGHLTFGLISIPIRLFRAARAERTPLKRVARVASQPSAAGQSQAALAPYLVPSKSLPETLLGASASHAGSVAPSSLTPVQQAHTIKGADSRIPETAITKAVEVEKGRFVEIAAEELKSLKAETSTEMAIQEFVPLSEIDPLYFESSYYVVPEEVGEKAYALLYQSLVNTNLIALAELAMHGRDHVVLLRPGKTGLVAHTMFYSSEVHLDEQFRADQKLISGKELQLGEMLIGSLTTTFQPEKYKNSYLQRQRELISRRVDSLPLTQSARVQELPEVVDIADALRKSLAQLKKPIQGGVLNPSDARPAVKPKRSFKSGA